MQKSRPTRKELSIFMVENFDNRYLVVDNSLTWQELSCFLSKFIPYLYSFGQHYYKEKIDGIVEFPLSDIQEEAIAKTLLSINEKKFADAYGYIIKVIENEDAFLQIDDLAETQLTEEEYISINMLTQKLKIEIDKTLEGDKYNSENRLPW